MRTSMICFGSILSFCFCLASSVTLAQQTKPAATAPQDVREYATGMKTVQRQLADGDVESALRTLEQTDESMRGIEFALMAATCRQGTSGVSDLIQRIAFPESVKSRYGVVHPSGDRVVFICQDGGLRRINPNDPDQVFDLVPHPTGASVWRAGFDGDGGQFFAAYGNGDVIIWDTDDWSTHQLVSLGDKPVLDLAVAMSGDAFAATGSQSVQLFKRDGDTFVHSADLIERLRFGNGIAFDPENRWVACGGMFDIRFHSVDGTKAPAPITHASYTMGITFAPDGQRIASAPRGNINKLLGIFRISDGQAIAKAGPFEKYIAGMAFSQDGRRLLCTGCEDLVRIFDVATGTVVLSISRPECGAEPFIVADDQVIAWSEPDGFCFIDLRKRD